MAIYRRRQTLADLRASYEPYVNGLSRHLRMPLPKWLPAEGAADNWEITAWEVCLQGGAP